MPCHAEGNWEQSGESRKEFQAPRAERQAEGPCLPPVGHLREAAGPSLWGGSARREVAVWDVGGHIWTVLAGFLGHPRDWRNF